MRKLFKNEGLLMANLYLEIDQSLATNLDILNSKVTVFGEFTKPKIWQEKIECHYDAFFKCFKSEMVTIKIGDKFKFIIT